MHQNGPASKGVQAVSTNSARQGRGATPHRNAIRQIQDCFRRDPGPDFGRPLESASSTAEPHSSVAPCRMGESFMQGKQTVIDVLNAGLTIELTAINQYFCQSKMCRNWGLNRLAAKHYHESLGEMKHAEFLIDRIIFLEGVPEIARYDVIRVGTNISEQLKNDLELETKGVRTYNDAIALCLRENDGGSRELLEKILVESEEHVDWLESQLDLIDKMGLQNYLVTQVGEDPEPSH
jgi:bacterioferritin